MIYQLKKGSWNVYLGPDGEKMPRTETALLKDLQVGDIIFQRTDVRPRDAYESWTVTDVRKADKEKLEDYHKRIKGSLFEVTVVNAQGRIEVLGPYRNDGGFMRQTSEAAWRKKQKEDMIIAHRSSVRTLLGTAESSMGERPKQQYLQKYWDEMNEIVQRLTKLELQMTLDAGRDPEKDKRKMTNHRGRARR